MVGDKLNRSGVGGLVVPVNGSEGRIGDSRIRGNGESSKSIDFSKIWIPTALPDWAKKAFWVYILASKHDRVLYIGTTNNLPRRMYEHFRHPKGFVAQYKLCKLVWAQPFLTAADANKRETQLKKWNRAWKVALIDAVNPHWEDLTTTIAV